MELQPVEAVEVTVLVDNFVDLLLPPDGVAQRPAPGLRAARRRPRPAARRARPLAAGGGRARRRAGDAALRRRPGARHRACTTWTSSASGSATCARSCSRTATPTTTAGSRAWCGARGGRGCRCVLHPDAWRERRVVFPSGAALRLPPPSRGDLEREGVAVGEVRSPSLLIDGAVLVTGQVERVTPFERGLPGGEARLRGSLGARPLDPRRPGDGGARGRARAGGAVGLQPRRRDQRAAPGPAADRRRADPRPGGRDAPVRPGLRAAHRPDPRRAGRDRPGLARPRPLHRLAGAPTRSRAACPTPS